MFYLIPWHSCLNLLETCGRNYITWLDNLLKFYCVVISQHAIFHKVRWMLTSNLSFKFPLVHELIVYGLFGIILHRFWLKILCETITDTSCNFSPSWKGCCTIYSKLFYAKIRKYQLGMQILPESHVKIQIGNC